MMTTTDTPAPLYDGRLSVKGKQWLVKPYNDVLAAQMVQSHALPGIAARILSGRDISLDKLDGFLNPRLNADFPDPFSLKNMTATAEFLAQQIINDQRIGILADFDVDGATSCAVMTHFLRHVTEQEDIPFFIPDRLNDGYGPSNRGFDQLKQQGADSVVVLDCGITSHAPLTYAKSIGLQTVIADHHEVDGELGLPNATHIINPKLPGDNAGLSMLAAVGVTFLLCVAINSVLRQRGHYTERDEPDMKSFLDLVALGTVCDMVPMTGPNRLFVKYGFAQMEKRNCVGLNALMEVSKISGVPDPYHAGFMLGPRINAGSRVHKSDLGAKLLSSTNQEDALNIAWLLDDCNRQRKDIQKDMTKEAMAMVTALNRENDPVIIVDDQGWHSGLTGLVAGALKERFARPACAIAYVKGADDVLEGRGSGRSVAGIHIADSFMQAQSQGLLVKGGGHAMAGGFTIEPSQLPAFHKFMIHSIEQQSQNRDSIPKTAIDAVFSPNSASVQLAEILNNTLAPFGSGNEEPTLALQNVSVMKTDIVGQTHLRCLIRDAQGGTSIKAIAFRAAEGPIGQALKHAASTGSPVHLSGCVKLNEWQGRRSAEFHIDDVMSCW